MISRSLALFIGLFSLLNIAGERLREGFDANIWWIDFRPAPESGANFVLGAASLLMIAYAAVPRMRVWRLYLTRTMLGVLAFVVAMNIYTFYTLLWAGQVRTKMPVPLSALIAAALVFIFFGISRAQRDGDCRPSLEGPDAPKPAAPGKRWRRWGVFAATLAACIVIFPLAQMLCFGYTDYRREADAIVVLGAGVYSDGKPSDALVDRVNTGCDLYEEGLAPVILFSGGPGAGSVSEPQAMRKLAMDRGVPESAILLDDGGVNTQATADNTIRMLGKMNAETVLAVSHFYHLPRVKMTYARAGWDVCTVPAKESYRLTAMPWYVTREVAALWWYYLRPLAGR